MGFLLIVVVHILIALLGERLPREVPQLVLRQKVERRLAANPLGVGGRELPKLVERQAAVLAVRSARELLVEHFGVEPWAAVAVARRQLRGSDPMRPALFDFLLPRLDDLLVDEGSAALTKQRACLRAAARIAGGALRPRAQVPASVLSSRH